MVKVMGILIVVHSLAWYFPLDFLEMLLFNLFAYYGPNLFVHCVNESD